MAEQGQVLVKVDRATKDRMKRITINWSAEIRRFIKERIDRQTNTALAVALTDRIFHSQKKSRGDVTLVIRKFRDARYGAGSG